MFNNNVGANVLAKKSNSVVWVKLKIVKSNTRPTDKLVTNTIKLIIKVNVLG